MNEQTPYTIEDTDSEIFTVTQRYLRDLISEKISIPDLKGTKVAVLALGIGNEGELKEMHELFYGYRGRGYKHRIPVMGVDSMLHQYEVMALERNSIKRHLFRGHIGDIGGILSSLKHPWRYTPGLVIARNVEVIDDAQSLLVTGNYPYPGRHLTTSEAQSFPAMPFQDVEMDVLFDRTIETEIRTDNLDALGDWAQVQQELDGQIFYTFYTEAEAHLVLSTLQSRIPGTPFTVSQPVAAQSNPTLGFIYLPENVEPQDLYTVTEQIMDSAGLPVQGNQAGIETWNDFFEETGIACIPARHDQWSIYADFRN